MEDNPINSFCSHEVGNAATGILHMEPIALVRHEEPSVLKYRMPNEILSDRNYVMSMASVCGMLGRMILPAENYSECKSRNPDIMRTRSNSAMIHASGAPKR